MKCIDDLRLAALLHEELPVSQREAMEGHIMGCEPCGRRYRTLRELIRLVRTCPPRSEGPHPDPAQFLDFLQNRRKGVHPLHAHFAGCDDCIQILSELSAMEEEIPSPGLKKRVLGMNLPASEQERLERRRLAWMIAAAVAAGALVVWIITMLMPGAPREPRRGPLAGKVRKQKPASETKPTPSREPEPGPEPAPEAGPGPAPAPRPKPRPEPVPGPEPGRQPAAEPKPVPPPGPGPGSRPAPKPEPPPAPASEPKPEPPGKTTPKPTFVDIRIERGAIVSKLHGGRALRSAFRASSSDMLSTRLRERSRIVLAGRITAVVDENSLFSVSRSGSDLEIHLHIGRIYFDVSQGRGEVRVNTQAGVIRVTGTAFAVLLRRDTTRVVVFKGKVRFSGRGREVTIKAGYESQARQGRPPRTPRKARKMEEIETWVSPARKEAPDIEFFERGPNGPPGLVLAVPHGGWEVSAETLAIRLSRRTEAGLVVARGYIAPRKGRWINVDRPTEGEVLPQGGVGPAQETDRARRVFEKFMTRAREAAASRDRRIRLFVGFRNHYEKLPVIEVATSGVNESTARQLRDLWPKACKKAKVQDPPAMRFDLLDPKYEVAGRQRTFQFSSTAQKDSGCLSGTWVRRGLLLYFPAHLDPGAYVQPFQEWLDYASRCLR